MQVMMGLPENLVISVLRSSRWPLLEQLSRLPDVLHMLALHAACPGIVADQSLRLQGGNYSPRVCIRDAEALGRVLSRLSTLQHLNLGRNNFGHEGAAALGPHLARLLSLVYLDIHRMYLGPLGATALAPHLGELTSLRHLHIGLNYIGPQGATALGRHLGSLSSLRHLDMQKNVFSARVAEQVGERLAKLSSLQCIRMLASDVAWSELSWSEGEESP